MDGPRLIIYTLCAWYCAAAQEGWAVIGPFTEGPSRRVLGKNEAWRVRVVPKREAVYEVAGGLDWL